MAYCTVADIRNAGLTNHTASDAAVLDAIELCTSLIDLATHQWFEPRMSDFYVDGNDSDTLHLNVPIITLDHLYANHDYENIVEPVYYRVYNNIGGVCDDRRNPRIKFIGYGGRGNIFLGPDGGTGRFRKGRQNQRLVGTFGYVEADGSTPRPIKRAITKLVIQKIAQPLYVDVNNPDPPIQPALPPIYSNGAVTDEWTDWHRIRRESSAGTFLPRRPSAMSELIDDAEVRGILTRYRSPLFVAATSSYGYRL